MRFVFLRSWPVQSILIPFSFHILDCHWVLLSLSSAGVPYFIKSRKLGTCDVEILMIEVSYSKGTSKVCESPFCPCYSPAADSSIFCFVHFCCHQVTLKFDVDQVGGPSDDRDEDWW